MKYLFIALEWFFNLFCSAKAKEIKREAYLERQNAVLNYTKVKQRIDKKQSKYSGRKKYQKV